MRLSILLLTVCAAASFLRADALEFTVTTTDGGTPVTKTVTGNRIISLSKNLVEREKEFAPFVGRSYVASVKFLGVKDAIQYSSNATGTSVTVAVPKTGYSRTFTGANATQVRNQVEDVFTQNVDGAYTDLQSKINEDSDIAPMDGNPQSATAWMSTGAFNRFAFQPIAGRDAFSLWGGGGFTAGFDYTSIHTDDGDVKAYDLDLALVGRFNDRVGITLATPFAYHETAGANVFLFGLEVGLPIYVLPPDPFSSTTFGWRVTPFASSAIAASTDLATGGAIAGGGVNSALDFYFGNTTVTIGDQIVYYTGISISYNQYQFDTDISQFILRNGVKVTQEIGSNGFIDGGVAYTNFLSGDAAVPNYWSPIVGVGLRFGNGNANFLRVGYNGDFASGYTGNGANILVSFSW